MHCVCLGELKADINRTLEAFEHILSLYQSGLHLDNLPPSIIRGRLLWKEGCFLRTEYTKLLCTFVLSCTLSTWILGPFLIHLKKKPSAPCSTFHYVSKKNEGQRRCLCGSHCLDRFNKQLRWKDTANIVGLILHVSNHSTELSWDWLWVTSGFLFFSFPVFVMLTFFPTNSYL